MVEPSSTGGIEDFRVTVPSLDSTQPDLALAWSNLVSGVIEFSRVAVPSLGSTVRIYRMLILLYSNLTVLSLGEIISAVSR